MYQLICSLSHVFFIRHVLYRCQLGDPQILYTVSVCVSTTSFPCFFSQGAIPFGGFRGFSDVCVCVWTFSKEVKPVPGFRFLDLCGIILGWYTYLFDLHEVQASNSILVYSTTSWFTFVVFYIWVAC